MFCAVCIIIFFIFLPVFNFHSASSTLSLTILLYSSRVFLLELPYIHSWLELLMSSITQNKHKKSCLIASYNLQPGKGESPIRIAPGTNMGWWDIWYLQQLQHLVRQSLWPTAQDLTLLAHNHTRCSPTTTTTTTTHQCIMYWLNTILQVNLFQPVISWVFFIHMWMA